MSEESKLREEIDKAHKRDRFWMILFPVVLISLAVVALVIWLAIRGSVGGASTANLAGVATVFLILLVFLFGLITLALLIGLTIGAIKLHEFIPLGGKAVRDYLSLGRHYLRVAEDASAGPILALRGLSAKIQQIGTSLTDRFSQKG